MSYYVTCRIGREWYGIPIENVLEVLHLVALNETPTSGKAGVMTLRERVITVIDMRKHFKVAEYGYSLDTPIIAVQTDAGELGLIVDETDNVVEIHNAQSQLSSEPGIKTVLRADERMIFVLDVPYLIGLQQHVQLE